MWEKASPGGSSTVQTSSTNGRLKINGTDIVVYDDTSVRSLIGGSAYIAGKKINCLGDSITAGNTAGAMPWTTILQNNYGCTVRNYGMNGTTLANNSSAFYMYYRYPSMDNDADIIILWGGYNDLNQGIPLGAFTDRVDTTFYGANHLILSGLQSKYLGKKIFVCTLMDTLHNWDTVKLWNQATRDVAEYYGVAVIDIARIAGINARNADVKASYIPDGTHPNTAGNTIIADVIAKFINSH